MPSSNATVASKASIGAKANTIDLDDYIPKGLRSLEDLQTAIPSLAKDPKSLDEIRAAVGEVPTVHDLLLGDARMMPELSPKSVHLVLTSPPYWTLKKYRNTEGQMGHIEDYEQFLSDLDTVWQRCYDALVPGGRLVCVVGDVCLSRRKNGGRHTVVPLHAAIQERCRHIGYDNLAPIIWHKISNAIYEVAGGSSFLGKPFEPNSVIKNDIEFILLERKPGGYRKPTSAARILSVISGENHQKWFQQIWMGLTGASTRKHPAPFPIELAERLIQMFSFVGDTVLDPFLGTGTTSAAAAQCGRNSIGYEIDEKYLQLATKRMSDLEQNFFSTTTTRVLDKHPTRSDTKSF
ncbi:MAG: site-specific DNA-methyltransferase [Planctomycetota bacterium]|nr:site-specific DNA-methyltransferase [Planctomycetota bacterium]